jgi:hypothetical protein
MVRQSTIKLTDEKPNEEARLHKEIEQQHGHKRGHGPYTESFDSFDFGAEFGAGNQTMPRGGRREGAGRKSNADKNAASTQQAEGKIRGKVSRITEDLISIAHGGTERIEERWEPAGQVVIEAVVRDAEGNPVLGTHGRPVLAKQAAYPDRDPNELVLVERRRSFTEPDRAANQYLLDRIMGRPKQAVEHSGPEGGAIPIAIEDAITRIYGDGEEGTTCEG